MKVLVLNCGSSSVKFQLIETSLEMIEKREDRVLAKGAIEKIGALASIVTMDVPGRERYRETPEILEHRVAIEKVKRLLTDPRVGVIPSYGSSRLTAMGVPFTCEADVGQAAAMLIVQNLTVYR